MGTRRAVLAGASGFVGRRLVRELTADGYEIARVGRSGPDARWGEPERLAGLVDGSDLLINLAGRSVGCRYTDAHRDEIYRSRIDTTAELHRAVELAVNPPSVWLNASTGTIYRYALYRPQTETDGELGRGFSVDVARDWESTFFAGDLRRTRRVALRMAIVLGDGPALQMLLRAARLGAGGPQIDGWWFPHRRYRGIGPTPTEPAATGHRSHGDQRFSWIHLDDLVEAVRFVIARSDLDGPVNLAAPGTSTNRLLMAELRRAARRPFGLPAYRWMLEPGMLVLRQESELLLKSRWVAPEKLLDAGFAFAWPELGPAITDLTTAPR
jgi:NAD dependent epimerase/dehydratase family enzyme